MRRAFDLSKKAVEAWPNPKVGCVLVRDGEAVGEGWTGYFGGAHAEAAALKQAGKKARGATAYCTLEPCVVFPGKKTASCARALANAGVTRVVVGMKDLHPKVAGKGIALLRKEKISVSVGLLKEEFLKINREYVVRMTHRRPYVILKAASSLDGRIETASGESKWITSPQARRESYKMRGQVDAILVGVGTVLADDPSLTAHGEGRDPLRVVVDSRLRTPRGAKVVDGKAPTVIATSSKSFSGRWGPKTTVLHVPKNGRGVDLKLLLSELGLMGVASILIEGGSEIHTSFIEQGLVDEFRLFLAPKLIGGRSARSFFEGRGFPKLSETELLHDVQTRRLGSDLLVVGKAAR